MGVKFGSCNLWKSWGGFYIWQMQDRNRTNQGLRGRRGCIVIGQGILWSINKTANGDSF